MKTNTHPPKVEVPEHNGIKRDTDVFYHTTHQRTIKVHVEKLVRGQFDTAATVRVKQADRQTGFFQNNTFETSTRNLSNTPPARR